MKTESKMYVSAYNRCFGYLYVSSLAFAYLFIFVRLFWALFSSLFLITSFRQEPRRARLCRLPERRRRRRISITAGWAAEGSEACGSKNDGKIVLEEGEQIEYLHSLLVFALFEDVMLSCCETAGYVRFALFTSGYGYSPPSATLAWDNFHLLNAKVQ